jgi:hypothetical protein
MLATMSHAEYVSWVAYYSVEPFPEERADLRNAMLISAVATMLGGRPKTKDFIVDWWKTAGEQQNQSPEEVLSKLKLIIGYGGRKN